MTNIYCMKTREHTQILPPIVGEHLRQLGQHIRIARKLRNITMEDMSQRVSISRETLRRLESGHHGVSLGILAQVLWVLNLEGNLENIASLAVDVRGQNLAAKQTKERVGKARTSKSAMSNKYDF